MHKYHLFIRKKEALNPLHTFYVFGIVSIHWLINLL
nr:MAG TPA: hypothetical protein [Caudoviricetes sp.]